MPRYTKSDLITLLEAENAVIPASASISSLRRMAVELNLIEDTAGEPVEDMVVHSDINDHVADDNVDEITEAMIRKLEDRKRYLLLLREISELEISGVPAGPQTVNNNSRIVDFDGAVEKFNGNLEADISNWFINFEDIYSSVSVSRRISASCC